MIFATPTSHFLTCGSAEGLTRPNAQDAARLVAGIGNVNLLSINAVLPPGCRFTAPTALPQGALVPAVHCAITSELPGEVISAGIAVAYPLDPAQSALVMDYSAPGHKEVIEAIVRRLAEEGLRARGLEIREIRSLAVQHRVEKIGSAVAALVLWQD
ncbi:pyruvoyl-dependent arginine decarboxylase [Geoalkalibacter sp.]|uniref:pyruvoyl-dependent arginine decarboxylase n=1 Tax=Geoalkalibacter sp. TaxID=3041440 RepID=UPI00272E6456|nr:arginine decarboxylase, pyruvoyl-dependent [Geoalkalibacter sp.]